MNLIYYLRVFDTEAGTPLGQLADITPQGMMLISDLCAETGRAYSLRMDLPKNVMGGGHIIFHAVCKWCRRENGSGYYSMGFTITDISPQEQVILQKLIKTFHLEHPDVHPDVSRFW